MASLSRRAPASVWRGLFPLRADQRGIPALRVWARRRRRPRRRPETPPRGELSLPGVPEPARVPGRGAVYCACAGVRAAAWAPGAAPAELSCVSTARPQLDPPPHSPTPRSRAHTHAHQHTHTTTHPRTHTHHPHPRPRRHSVLCWAAGWRPPCRQRPGPGGLQACSPSRGSPRLCLRSTVTRPPVPLQPPRCQHGTPGGYLHTPDPTRSGDADPSRREGRQAEMDRGNRDLEGWTEEEGRWKGGRDGRTGGRREGGREERTERRSDGRTEWGREGARDRGTPAERKSRLRPPGATGRALPHAPARREKGQRPARAEGWAHSRRVGRRGTHAPRNGPCLPRRERPRLGWPSGVHPHGLQTCRPQAEPCTAARGGQPRPHRGHTQDD